MYHYKSEEMKTSLFVKSPYRIQTIREIAGEKLRNRENYGRKVLVTLTESKKSLNGIFNHVLL